MQFRTLGFLLLLTSTVVYGQGRAPAVEDFVGIEVEQPEQAPPGTEALFNFEKDINRFEEAKAAAPAQTQNVAQEQLSQKTNFAATFGIAFVLGLPLISWLMIMSHLRKKASEASAPNIRVFEEYKRERQARKSSDEDIRKAS